MQTEIEAKWLNIDIEEFRNILKSAGAELITAERLMIRQTYDFPDKSLNSIGGWVRVRNEGGKITMSYKQLNDRTLHGTKEITVIVDDYDATCNFLESIGLVMKSVQETKRESWMMNGCEIELDTWPWIPSFVEIEAPDEASLRETAEILGLNYSTALHGSVEPAYQDVYDVSDVDINSWDEVRFTDVPSWLLAKKLY